MITNVGKGIISKFLINQAPAYASYMAFGSGPKPLSLPVGVAELGDAETKTSLDFEMFRVPISSRGYVVEDGETSIVLTAELPTDERYSITEIGLYPAANNPSAVGRDSRIVFSFNEQENWEYHSATTATAIPSPANELIIDSATGNFNPDPATFTAFRIQSSNPVFDNQSRLIRYERPRCLDSNIMVPGSSSTITVDPISGLFSVTGDHIHLNNAQFNFDQNSPKDEIRLAFSVVNKLSEGSTPLGVKVIVEFAYSDDASTNTQSARLEYSGSVDSSHRYIVVSEKLEDLIKTPNFAWSGVNVVKVYVSVDDPTPSDYYVCLDAIRLENVSDVNPLYGLTAYSKIINDNALPFIKAQNSSNLVEFRFGLGV